jgi:hypothetical protein
LRKEVAALLRELAVDRALDAAPDALEERRLIAVDTEEVERPTSGAAGEDTDSRSAAASSTFPAWASRVSGFTCRVVTRASPSTGLNGLAP